MRRLTAADSWYLYAETERVHTHVTGAVVLDPSTSPDTFDFAKLRAHIDTVAPLLNGFRQRLVPVPFGIDHPLWIDDPDFDLDDHVHRHELPAPGGDDELAAFIGEFTSTQLRRDRPLWEMALVEGLTDGRVALVAKMHHAIIDGVSGVDMMAYLLSMTPEGDPLPLDLPDGTDGEWVPDRVPGALESVLGATWSRLTQPQRPVRAVGRTATGVARAARAVLGTRRSGGTLAGPFEGPRTPWNGALTARRAVAFAHTSLDSVRETRSALGVTVNDIVLAACTLGLRTVLVQAGEATDGPLVASVPVSVHGRAGDESTNQVSAMFTHLPVQVADPLEMVAEVHEVANGAKELHTELGPDVIGDMVDLIPPPVFHLGAEAFSRSGIANLAPPAHNLIVSNVPGSPVRLYMAGAEVVALHPFGPLIEGCGLNVTVLSHLDQLHIGLIGCPDLLPDIDGVLEAIVDGFDELHKLALNLPGAAED